MRIEQQKQGKRRRLGWKIQQTRSERTGGGIGQGASAEPPKEKPWGHIPVREGVCCQHDVGSKNAHFSDMIFKTAVISELAD